MLPKENVVPMLLIKITESTKRETGNALIEVFARKKGNDPTMVLFPRPVPPRKVASCGTKESNASSDVTFKKR